MEVMSDTANSYVTGNKLDANFISANYKVTLPLQIFPIFTL